MRFTFFILLFIPGATSSQTLTEGSMIRLRPDKGEEVVLYSAQDCIHCYYYLPSELRISTKPGNTIPEVSLTTWKNDEASEVVGGIFHFLVVWGLSAEREKMIQKILSERDSLSVIIGPVLVNAGSNSVVIEGDDKLSSVLKTTLQNKPMTPTIPGAKMALSFRFTEREITDFLYYLDRPVKTNTNLMAAYTYSVKTVSGREQINTVALRLPLKQILTILKENK